jgi:ribosomal protein L40E
MRYALGFGLLALIGGCGSEEPAPEPQPQQRPETPPEPAPAPEAEKAKFVMCPACKAMVDTRATSCPKCQVSMVETVCKNCGTKIKPGVKFCDKCGQSAPPK